MQIWPAHNIMQTDTIAPGLHLNLAIDSRCGACIALAGEGFLQNYHNMQFSEISLRHSDL